MSRTRSDALTGELFSMIPQPAPVTPGALDLRKRFASMVSDSISDYRGKDGDTSKRYFIAARMSELADVETSKGLLDSYSAPSREECNLPGWKIPCFEVATGSKLFTNFLVGFHGGVALWGKDVMDAEIGRMQREMDDLKRRLAAATNLRRRAG